MPQQGVIDHSERCQPENEQKIDRCEKNACKCAAGISRQPMEMRAPDNASGGPNKKCSNSDPTRHNK